ncbi:MAG TPA: hypothetical protein DEQ09_02435 [Bacteroidales bacterium]|nr:hypothetical protein [Bacteroidales bacterium]
MKIQYDFSYHQLYLFKSIKDTSFFKIFNIRSEQDTRLKEANYTTKGSKLHLSHHSIKKTSIFVEFSDLSDI